MEAHVLIVMNHNAGDREIAAVVDAVKQMGFQAVSIPGSERTAIGVLGNRG